MSIRNAEFEYFVDAAPEEIYAHLAVPQNYVGLSPLIVAVDERERGVDAHKKEFIRYTSIERFHFFGMIRYDNHINVLMTFTEPNQQVISKVDSPLNIHVLFTFDLTPQGKGTLMKETIHAEAPALLMNYVIGQAQSVQLARSNILKQRMEV